MKINKTICIDFELIEKLKKEDNSSSIINGLLIDYYKEDNTVKSIESEQKELKGKIKELKSEQKEAVLVQKRGENMQKIALNDEIKAWFIKKPIEPSPLEIDLFLKSHKMNREKPMLEYIKDWRLIKKAQK